MNATLPSLLRHGAFALVCGVPFVGGCADDFTCTTEARPSVLVDVVDIDGNPLAGAAVTFTHEGTVDEPCVAFGDPGRFSCGYELRGTITVRATLAGHVDASTSVVVAADRCHVITQTAELTLETSLP